MSATRTGSWTWGCGPGALTARLVARLGAGQVAAVDPSEPFVAAARSRLPGVDVRVAAAESLPFDDDAFDAVLAQLVVHFMADPVAGLAEMARVARPGGTVAACVWDHAGGTGPLTTFWRAVADLDPGAHDESGLAGAREGHLAELAAAAGLEDVAPAGSRSPSASRTSRSGGSRSRSASAPPGRTSTRSTYRAGRRCGTGAPHCCPQGPSTWSPRPGGCGVSRRRRCAAGRARRSQ